MGYVDDLTYTRCPNCKAEMRVLRRHGVEVGCGECAMGFIVDLQASYSSLAKNDASNGILAMPMRRS